MTEVDPTAVDPMAASAPPAAAGPDTLVRREPDPNQPDANRAFVAELAEWVRQAKAHHKRAFDRMREDMDFALRGADKEWVAGDNYVANITLRQVRARVSALYAKNPRIVARRRKRLDFAMWDEKPESFQMAAGAAMGVGPDGMSPVMPEQQMQAMALMQDVQQGVAERLMYERVAKTLELAATYYINEQEPRFKPQAKQLIRRVATCGVGYFKLNYQRIMEPDPDLNSKIADFTERLQHLERLIADAADEEFDEYCAEMEELRLAIASLQENPEIIVREGPLFTFPMSTAVIPDPNCRQLKGWIGQKRMAEEFILTPHQIQELYGVDVSKAFTPYSKLNPHDAMNPHRRNWAFVPSGDSQRDAKDQYAVVWEIYDAPTGLVFTVCDGYPEFLTPPARPRVQVEQFFPFWPVTFNDVEHHDEIFPPSDVRLMRHMQEERNRSRQMLREHRFANRPTYVTPSGAFEEEDKAKLQNHPANAILEMQGLDVGEKIADKIQALPTTPIDPNLYETGPFEQDLLQTIGTHEAHLGGTSGDTATEAAIAEGAKMSSDADARDELDDVLSEVMRAMGQVMLMEIAPETIRKIVGPGAVWPQLSRREIAEEIQLEIEAGSSGRPNKAQELANAERITPLLLQIPGVNPTWLAKQLLIRMDEKLDLTDALIDGLPSILAMNAAAKAPAQPSTGDPASDPGQQGDKGGDNAPKGQQRPGGPQPAMPAAGEATGGRPAATGQAVPLRA